jgi:hypothetical protein
LDEVEDKPINPEDFEDIMKLCEGGYIAEAEVSGKDGEFSLQLFVDAVDSNDTYCITFSFTKSSSTWERFLQKAEEFTFQND